jgi:hypothetical protein
MKSSVLPFCILLFSFSLNAQTEQLIVKTSNKGPYVEHTVTAKENFYSIGRSFNVHPKHLALFNSLAMTKGLSLGQTIKIPLTDTNYTHKSEIGTPVYYITSNNETVYNVSTNNDVLMEKLRKWNSITTNKPPTGSKLIVGYLMTGQSQALAVNSNQNVADTVNKTKDNSKAVAKTETSNKQESKKEQVKSKDEPKKENETIQPKQDLNKDKVETKKKTEVVQTKEETTMPALGQGYFRSSFDQQVKQVPLSKDETVTSGIFKTSSGWSDAKYYLLMDGAEPGTIVKITNPTNNKAIYAKLLGEMTDLKQNQGLNIRISNAAAAALEISETDKFIVKVNY